jgi:coenzyme F420-0:L-glutamate ligase/coenzyme F420-1:gamma-L-glutamate ligase
MQVLPIHTPIFRKDDDIVSILQNHATLEHGDILVISSKVIATVEGDATLWAATSGRTPAFCQAVLTETKRLNGRVLSAVKGALLTELLPTGMDGGLLVPNAGLDESNCEDGMTIGWPIDPVLSARQLSAALGLPVIISDSTVSPRRRGVTAFALTCCGLDPLQSQIGKKDLFQRSLTITVEAIADQLAIAGNAVMGNAGQSIPAAIIRDHYLLPSEFCGWVPGMNAQEDLFKGIL